MERIRSDSIPSGPGRLSEQIAVIGFWPCSPSFIHLGLGVYTNKETPGAMGFLFRQCDVIGQRETDEGWEWSLVVIG